MEQQLIDRLIKDLKGLYGQRQSVFLHEPLLGEDEILAVTDCVKSKWVSSASPWSERFEQEICKFTGSRYAVAVVNGTSALHCSLYVLGVTQQDEVIVPAISFAATANAVKFTGATPHFVDIEERSFGIDPVKLSEYLKNISIIKNGVCHNKVTNRPIKALVAVHIFGHPANIEALQEICNLYNITFIEDAAESLGSTYKGKHTGCFGTVGILSFNGNKIITTGGGGAILTQDEDLAKKIRHVATTAKVPHSWEYFHDQLGFNYRMPGINAALGCAQIKNLDVFLRQKRKLAKKVNEMFKNGGSIKFFSEPDDTVSNYWLLAIQLPVSSLKERNDIIEKFHAEKIFVRPIWNTLARLPMYKDAPCMNIDTALAIEKSVINIPSSAFLSEDH